MGLAEEIGRMTQQKDFGGHSHQKKINSMARTTTIMGWLAGLEWGLWLLFNDTPWTGTHENKYRAMKFYETQK